MGYVWSKTKSLGKIFEKPCVCCRGHIYRPMIMKLDQNVCVDELSDEFQNGSCLVKKLGH